MKRVLVAIACVVAPSVANSERVDARVVMTPTIPRVCRSANSWDKITTCLERFGKAKVERELPSVKLVSITTEENVRVPGLYLYKQQGKNWVIAGMYELTGTFEVKDLTQPTIAKHTGFRFDVGIVQPTSESDVAPAGVMRARVSVFCSGASYFCTEVMTSCEWLVEGRARETFRGTLTIKGGSAVVSGDNSRASQVCSSSGATPLFFDSVSSRAPIDPFM